MMKYINFSLLEMWTRKLLSNLRTLILSELYYSRHTEFLILSMVQPPTLSYLKVSIKSDVIIIRHPSSIYYLFCSKLSWVKFNFTFIFVQTYTINPKKRYYPDKYITGNIDHVKFIFDLLNSNEIRKKLKYFLDRFWFN